MNRKHGGVAWWRRLDDTIIIDSQQWRYRSRGLYY